MADAALTPTQIAGYAYRAGFRGPSLTTAVAIALAESSGHPRELGDVGLEDGTWGPSVGLWQIRSLWDQTGTGGQRDREANLDPLTNARHAFQISGGGTDFQPWSTYLYGQYRAYLGPAAAAAHAVLADPPGTPAHRTGHHPGTGRATTTVGGSGGGAHGSGTGGGRGERGGRPVEVLSAEMGALGGLLEQGHTDVSTRRPLADRAVTELRHAAALPVVGTEAAALVPLATELSGLLGQLAAGLAADRELVARTRDAAHHADRGGVPPAVAKLLPPGLVGVLDHGGATAGGGSGAHHPAPHHTAAHHPTTHHTATPHQAATAGATVTAEQRRVVQAAERFLGVPYVYGGDSGSGVDCSGLTHLAYLHAFGRDIGRDTTAQLAAGRTVGRDGDWALDRRLLQPGDLLFYGRPGASGPDAHVVMYLGGGRVIQAPYTGQRVQINPLFERASADEPFLGVRRYLPVPAGHGAVPA